MRKLTTEEFVEKAKTVHGDKYDYSKVEYLNNSTYVCIICPEHGEFWQKPSNHLMGNGCPKCNGKGLSSEEYIIEAHKVHGDKYDYSKVDYKSKKEKICIICPEHGEFWQIAQSHLSGHGCPKCAIEHCSDTQRLSKEDFISKAKSIHGDKYDYSKVEYVNAQTKVCITCPEHGEFLQVPNAHLRGSGCPKCGGKLVNNTEDFISRSNEIHNNKYDYSKVKYINSQTKVCIICPKHGEFWVTPNNHLRGKGCPKCSGKYKTTQEFIELAKKVHNNKYDYSKTIFVNNATKVCIICPEHGEFWQRPYQHLNGNGCPECAFEKTKERLRLTTKEFIRKACEVHGDKYDYSKVEYVGNNTLVCIICPEHGEFWQTPASHWCGNGCPKCAGNYKYTTEEWKKKAKAVHGDKYDYSKVEYVDAKTPVCIICPEHGEFWQRPSHHINGVGCPNCQGLRKQYKFNLLQEFESEYELRAFLENNDVNILYVILRNVEPKFEPIKADIEKALKNIELKDPIQALEDKYAKDDEEEAEETSIDTKEEEVATVDITSVDLDDENAVNDAIGTKETEDEEDTNTEPTIEDVVKNTEKELEVISKIEHMLTPEDREYIMEKFLNDKLRDWMANREASKNN